MYNYLDFEKPVADLEGQILELKKLAESGEAVDRIRDLAAGKSLYVHCKLGGRSAKAVALLAGHGIEAINVTGGIDAWSQQVDPSVPRY